MTGKSFVKTSVLMLMAAFMTACSPQINVPATRPDDFSLTYHWQEGSLPPPYHYEFTIIVLPDGQGQIEYIPDYPADETPVWIEGFALSEVEMDRLYEMLVEKNFFETRWQAQADPPVGGSSESLLVTDGGSDVEMPSFVLHDQELAASEISTAIKALVPKAIWAKLEQQREHYLEEHMND